MKYAVLAATLAASVAATPSHHHHHHAHRHAKKHAPAKVEKRAPDVVTEVVVGATATVFELDGKIVDAATAKAGLAEGEYIIVGETTPTFTPPPPPPPATSSAAPLRAQFVEEPISSPAAPTTTSAPPPPPTTTAQATTSSAPSSTASKPASSSPVSGATGLDADFPSGKISCHTFPSEYGAVALDWLGTGGWSGLQFVPDYSPDSQSITDIITGIAGQTCGKGAMCSYACPPGYQKTQWPKAQGSTLESIGGLYCNEDGFLELTRPDHPKLCEAGAGGVSIKNELDDSVCTCRTDYPGIESMVIPACASGGETIELTNPDESDYYVWDGKSTSAQYYVNKKGYAVEDACVWNSSLDPKGAGNWSPVIIGTGKTSDGTTWLSIFQNLPTSTALLDFNIEITGDVSSKCSYINGQWTGGDNGCTTSMPSGGSAVIRYF
ncbi:glycoside hydrolase family 132 protein [Trichoderma longibrachiatum]|uniref:Glycoside hydrolase family 132 protein n=1 Tax=Trichoderma longibrachiatum ATCC 18648 TaxID=983965 RepID=A0A2T4CGZ5_TRILO|nr:glycoside hydrolase family 132 protein [Trichoderma longibrachiatum ATCC 18648]